MFTLGPALPPAGGDRLCSAASVGTACDDAHFGRWCAKRVMPPRHRRCRRSGRHLSRIRQRSPRATAPRACRRTAAGRRPGEVAARWRSWPQRPPRGAHPDQRVGGRGDGRGRQDARYGKPSPRSMGTPGSDDPAQPRARAAKSTNRARISGVPRV